MDTFNFNAHTTASDALWSGLPLVTKMGKGFAARVAGSLLTAIELPELITTSEENAVAVELSATEIDIAVLPLVGTYLLELAKEERSVLREFNSLANDA